jgi:hypothetical protein
VAVFLGTQSPGCGYDNGFRTYSMGYLQSLIDTFRDRFTVVVIGQSQVRTPAEMDVYREMLARDPAIVDLVDKTSLDELLALMDRFALVVSCDSSPIHLALARGTPVVGLYVHEGAFRMAPRMVNDRFVAINSAPPCFQYSWRWKFFCESCRDADTRAYYCHNKAFEFGVDRIPVSQVDAAARHLLGTSPHLAPTSGEQP